MRNEISLDELKTELRNGARCFLQIRHGERPKMDLDDPTFGDALHLTREGVRTAKIVGSSLREFASTTRFCTSPLTRTRETAANIAEGMGIVNPEIISDDRLGNGSFYYTDPQVVLKTFKVKDFFKACFEYFEKGELPGFRNIYEAADDCERWLESQSGDARLLIAATHDCYLAAFLSARGAYGPFSRDNWPRFLDGAAILLYPDGSRRYALLRSRVSHGICGVRPVRGVVFDFGGVMTTTVMPERVRKVTDALGIDWKILEEGFLRYRRLMDGGFIDLAQMYDNIWADADIRVTPEQQEEILREDTASFLYRNEATLDWMKELKASGKKIGILTNMPPAFAVRFRESFADYISLADAMVISGEAKMFKPQKRIYDLLRDQIGLHSDELCFIDDSEMNCEGARCSGWHAIRFENTAQASRDFAERYA